jgi:hypothetical protein
MNKDINYQKRDGGSRLAAIRVSNIDDSLEVLIFLITNLFNGSNIDLVVWKLYPSWRCAYNIDAI